VVRRAYEIPPATLRTVAETRNGKTGNGNRDRGQPKTVTKRASRGVTVSLTGAFARAQAVAVTG
jgi:hypothetical protein